MSAATTALTGTAVFFTGLGTARTRAIPGLAGEGGDRLLKLDGEVGHKKAHDPRSC